jgi:hypothetical protein
MCRPAQDQPLCPDSAYDVGSSPADWTEYASAHDLHELLRRPETSAMPLPAGTCTSSS